MSLPPLPSLPRLPRLPGGHKPQDAAAFPVLSTDAHEPDAFGLDPQIFKTPVSPLARSYVRKALDFLGLPLNVNPATFINGGGTIPEMVTFGGLLARGYRYNQQLTGGFTYQSSRLGGRAAGGGGAVLDFIVWQPARAVGVDVDSFFHSLGGTFSGGAKVEKDINQTVKLLSHGSVQAFYRINLVQRGCALEFGNNQAVVDEFDRMARA